MTHRRLFPALPALAAVAVALVSAAAPAVTSVAMAQPVDSVLNGFGRTGEYLLTVDGKAVPNAEIYKNERLPAYLILAPVLPSPVLLTPRTMEVETLSPSKLVRQKDGTVDVLADAETKPQGKFRLEGDRVVFTAQGRKASLGSNPPLLGAHAAPALKSHSPEYVVTARGYAPNGAALAALKKEARPVQVKVFFGSWCPHCKKHLPYLMRVEDDLKGSGSGVKFDYYGLPPRFANEPQAKRFGVDGVPLAIVYVNGKEAGRIRGGGWENPEVTLRDILSGKAAPGR